MNAVLGFAHVRCDWRNCRRAVRSRQRDGEQHHFRRVADALAGAPLIADGERQGQRPLSTGDGDRPTQRLRVDLGQAEVRIVFLDAGWQLARIDAHVGGDKAGCFNREFAAVQVIPWLDIEMDFYLFAAVRGRGGFECQVRGQKTHVAGRLHEVAGRAQGRCRTDQGDDECRKQQAVVTCCAVVGA